MAAQAGRYLTVDTSELNSTMALMQSCLSRQNFNKLMQRTLGEVGRKSKAMIAKEVAKEYEVTQKWARTSIGGYTIKNNGGNVSCTIPLRGKRGSIGGTFKASGGSSKDGVTFSGITATIIRGRGSRLPRTMSHQGGGRPFIMKTKGSKSYKLAMTRTGKGKIVSVVGLGLPQMPLNQAQEGVQDTILEYAGNRLEHNFQHMFG